MSAAFPIFSVVIAVFNAELYLDATLRSIQAQTLTDFEVVLVDDGSTDGSARIARQYCSLDARFHLHQTPNRGISAARNLAISQTTAPWIAVCDADDTWETNKLELQARFIREWEEADRPPLVALGTAGDLIDKSGAFIWPVQVPAEPWLSTEAGEPDVLELNMINSSSVFRREAFEQVGRYREEYTPAEDTDLWIRLAELGSIINLPEALTHYRMHDSNISEKRYLSMSLNALRIQVNAWRRARHLAEWSAAEYLKVLRSDREGYRSLMAKLRHKMYFNQAKNSWSNRLYVNTVRALILALLVSPGRTFGLSRNTRMYRRLSGGWWRQTGGPAT